MGKLILTAKRFRPPAQGCRRGYPGIRNENDYPTARRLRHFFVEFPAQGSRSGNPGLEDVGPLCGLHRQARGWTFLHKSAIIISFFSAALSLHYHTRKGKNSLVATST